MSHTSIKRKIAGYIACSICLFFFQLIYHLFSHGVVSTGLKYVWLIPLVGGLAVIFLDWPLHTLSNRLVFNMFNTSLALLCNVLILQGILDIAGSDSPYLTYFYLLALPLLALSLILFIGSHLFEKRNNSIKHE